MLAPILLFGISLISRQAAVTRLEGGQTFEGTLALKQTDSYSVKLRRGQFLTVAVMQKGVDVFVQANDPSGKKIFYGDSPNGDQGEEPCQFVAKADGVYKILVAPLPEDTAGGNYSIRLVSLLSAEEYAKKKADEAAALEHERLTVATWLKSNAVPIKTVHAESGLEDLQQLKRVLDGVQIVGLGEATHGTKEFFQMKHRMLEFLAKDMGFTVFAMEATYAEVLKINDYVLRGEGDPEVALRGQYFWTWDTAEVLDMVRWMRRYNESQPEEKKLKFLGFDVQAAKFAGRNVVAFLQKVDPDRVAEVKGLLVPIYPLADGTEDNYRKLPAETHTKQHDGLMNIVTSLLAKQEDYVAKSSRGEFDEALDSAREILHFQEVLSVSFNEGTLVRDEAMAHMVQDLYAQQPAGTKMVLWAHNYHVQRVNKTMGSYLATAFGPKYYSIGFAFDEGSFQAINGDPKSPPGKGLRRFDVRTGGPSTLGWFLKQAGPDRYFVDWRSLQSSDPMSTWVHTPHPGTDRGAVAVQANLATRGPVDVGVFDGLIFIRKTSRATPNAAWKLPIDPKVHYESPFGE